MQKFSQQNGFSSSFALLVGIMACGLGVMVMFGWWLKIPLLVQVMPAWTPMQFNTAILVLLSGLSLAFLVKGYKKTFEIASWGIGLLSGLTLAQYIFNVNVGIDTFFTDPFTDYGTRFPGRMAPTTALCFFLLGLQAYFCRKNFSQFIDRVFAIISIMLIVFLSALSVVSYFLPVDVAFGWGNFSRMAFHTSVTIWLLGVSYGSFLFPKMRIQRTLGEKIGLRALTVTVVFFIGTLTLWQLALHKEKLALKNEFTLQSKLVGEAISSNISERAMSLSQMARRWEVQGGTPEKVWRADAINYLSQAPGIRAIGISDASYVVRWVEPKEPGKASVGFNLLSEDNRRVAIYQSVAEKRPVMTKAVQLKRGGYGAVLFVPLFNESRVDGLISTGIEYASFFKEALKNDDFSIWIKEGDNLLFHKEADQEARSPEWDTQGSVDLPGTRWNWTLRPTETLLSRRTSLLPLTILAVGVLITVLFSVLVYLQFRTQESEAKLKIAVERSQMAIVAKSQFLANVSHEVRTPINGIMGMSQLLFATPLNSEQKGYLDAITVSAKSLLTLINDILDLSKIEAGKLTLELVDFDFQEVLEESVGTVRVMAANKNIAIDTSFDFRSRQFFYGDPSRLKQVILNLLSNAIKFTHFGGQVSLRAYVQEYDANNRFKIRVEVKDSGIGISPENQKKLFQSFSQAEATTARRYGGTGLGLAISKSLIQQMNGEIGVSSVLDHGSTFWFEVPLAEGKESSSERTVKEAIFKWDLQTPLRVLIAEDNDINQKVAISILEKMGCQFQVAANGLETMQKLKESQFDLILMDCQMPEMDGYEATQRIRKESSSAIREIPIIAMTGNALEGDREKCLAVGMNDYITKPVDFGQLQEVLKRWSKRHPESPDKVDHFAKLE